MKKIPLIEPGIFAEIIKAIVENAERDRKQNRDKIRFTK
jgi:hypothetical protein